MKYSGIGGQAVMEGVMMKNQDKYAVAVRKPNHEIEVKVQQYGGASEKSILRKIPLVRGVVNFIDSLYLGMSTLMYSASLFEEEPEEPQPPKDTAAADGEGEREELTEEEKREKQKKEERQEHMIMGGTVVFSLVVALGLFFVLPYFLSGLFRKVLEYEILVSCVEGVIRLLIFVGYILAISRMPDIRRVFMYHGAEHKCINCIEHGLELNIENVKKSSKEHKRCGTSFLLIVMLVSIVVFMFIQTDIKWLRFGLRLLLIPVIAGISYEFLRLAGRFDNWFINLLSMPGLWMQRLTTKEPDEEMIEVGIASVNAVFDWREWQNGEHVGTLEEQG